MFREKYYLNTTTLRFEKIQKSFRRKLLEGFVYFSILSVLATGIRVTYDRYFDSPKIKVFTEKCQELRSEYAILNNGILESEFLLGHIRNRDDKLYRAVFSLDPIPGSVREAGFGGSENFNNLLYSKNIPLVSNTARKLEKLLTKARIQSNSLNDLMNIAIEKQRYLAHIPSLQPISPSDKYWLTSTFGLRFDPFTKGRRFHQGIDLAGQVGLKIYATGEGKITLALKDKGYGNEIVIDHGYDYKTRYAHLHKIHVKKGDVVKRGQLIGELGSTGRSTGPHLHYEVLYKSKAVNPLYYFYENLSPEEFAQLTILSEK